MTMQLNHRSDSLKNHGEKVIKLGATYLTTVLLSHENSSLNIVVISQGLPYVSFGIRNIGLWSWI